MKYEIPLRINVLRPLAGMTMQVQKGRDDLVPPVKASSEQLTFDFSVNVDSSSDTPNFLGKFAQGPKDARFIYINSGTMADQADSYWTRARVSLMNTAEQIEGVLSSPGSKLEVTINDIARDGGPVCASVKSSDGWRVVKG